MRGLFVRLTPVLVFLVPLAAFAAGTVEDDTPKDPRMENFNRSVSLKDTSVGLTWMLFIFLILLVIGVLFKNAKRTHLD